MTTARKVYTACKLASERADRGVVGRSGKADCEDCVKGQFWFGRLCSKHSRAGHWAKLRRDTLRAAAACGLTRQQANQLVADTIRAGIAIALQPSREESVRAELDRHTAKVVAAARRAA